MRAERLYVYTVRPLCALRLSFHLACRFSQVERRMFPVGTCTGQGHRQTPRNRFARPSRRRCDPERFAPDSLGNSPIRGCRYPPGLGAAGRVADGRASVCWSRRDLRPPERTYVPRENRLSQPGHKALRVTVTVFKDSFITKLNLFYLYVSVV